MLSKFDKNHSQASLLCDDLMEAKVLVFGLGIIGSWMASAFARVARSVVGIDPERVLAQDVAAGLFSAADIGFPKAEAVGSLLQGFDYRPRVHEFHAEQTPNNLDIAVGREYLSPADLGGDPTSQRIIVVNCTHVPHVRHAVAEFAKQYADLLIDSWTTGDIATLYCVPTGLDTRTIDAYLHFLKHEPYSVPAIGRDGSAFVSMWVASQAVSSANRYLRGIHVPYKVIQDVGMGMPMDQLMEAPLPRKEEQEQIITNLLEESAHHRYDDVHPYVPSLIDVPPAPEWADRAHEKEVADAASVARFHEQESRRDDAIAYDAGIE